MNKHLLHESTIGEEGIVIDQALSRALAGGGAILLALLAWMAARTSHPPLGLGWPDYLLLAGAGVGLALLALSVLAMDRQQRRLERLRGAMLISAGLGTALPRPSANAWAICVSPMTSRIALSAADLTVASGARMLNR